VLTATEAKDALRQLPFRLRFRRVALPEGASGAVAGRAEGRHHTLLNFGIALGKETDGVPVPRADTAEITGYENFVFTDDLEVPGKHEKWEPGPQFHTAAQWSEAGHMDVELREAICIAETGRVCPVGG
jgi:hypothetical protein